MIFMKTNIENLAADLEQRANGMSTETLDPIDLQMQLY